MTEAEWLNCADPVAMLHALNSNELYSASHLRALRLFAVACCRRFWDRLTDPANRRAVEAAEAFADGLPWTYPDLTAARVACRRARPTAPAELAAAVTDPSAFAAAAAVARSLADAVWHPGLIAPGEGRRAARRRVVAAERRAACDLLRDVIGNPWRAAPAVAPAWLAWNAGTVPRLARAAYEDRQFDRLPVLADALEEAGCDSADLLGHLRGPGPHARGCFVLDLILGKS